MAKIDRDELEQLMNKVGIDARTKKRMHAGNGTDQSEPAASKPKSRARGHGAPAPFQVVADEL